jgi:uncharacterized protein YqeY
LDRNAAAELPWRAARGYSERRSDSGDSMSMRDRLAADLKEAMREGDDVRRDVLRYVMTAMSNAAIAKVNVKDETAVRGDLSDADAIDVLQKQAKQRRDSIEEYRKAGREDLAQREEQELAIITTYLPEQMSRDEVAAEVRAIIAETGASGAAAKGKVMPVAMSRLRGRADGRTVNEVVTELLSSGGSA